MLSNNIISVAIVTYDMCWSLKNINIVKTVVFTEDLKNDQYCQNVVFTEDLKNDQYCQNCGLY